MFCPNCGKKQPDTAVFCGECGTPLARRETPSEEIIPVTSPAAEPVAQEVPEAVTPAEEISTEEAVLAQEPVTEAPVEETPVEEEPAAEAPVAAPVEEVPAKAEKPRKKKKALFWVLGSVAVVLVAAVLVALFVVKPYYEHKIAYGEATKLLEERNYDKALEKFKVAGDYEDAPEKVKELEALQSEYDLALQMLDEGYFDEALDKFINLGEYRDSMDQKQVCYFGLAWNYLSQRELVLAANVAENMDEATYERYIAAYNEFFADTRFLTDLEEVLLTRYSLEAGEQWDRYQIAADELAILGDYRYEDFVDFELGELAALYIDGVELEKDSAEEDSGYYDHVTYYTGVSYRSTAVETLVQEFAFLKDQKEVRDSYAGKAELCRVLMEVEADVGPQLLDNSPVQGADGKDYLPYINHTQWAYTIRVFNNFYDQDDNLLQSSQAQAYVIPGEKVYLLVELPEVENAQWYIDWEITEVETDLESLDIAGQYQISAMIVQDVYYSGDALDAANLAKDSVVVTLNADGTGTWKEMETTLNLTYADGTITFSDDALELPYLIGTDKLIVNLGDSIYILEK